ncbi:MAG TPA: RagB/SusD family nutrient uptake outer membrane protein, partial [Chitinophaga sp.]|uniref:RagB/SusD family nutrient uptake outer membrane protein n=1 Tax=Chitinophaga sp. TaxID=1869181 RepID=UPI002B9BA2AA
MSILTIKHIRFFLAGCIALGFSACNKQELDQQPPTAIGENSFWTSANDVKLYANSFYNSLPSYGGYGNVGPYSDDVNSDNLVGAQINVRNNGQSTPPTNVFGYDFWGDIRRVNYLLVNYSKTPGDFNAYKTFVGEAYFFRAWYYFERLKNYGGMPWINKPLNTNDTALL